jgi:predicted ATPase
MKYTKFIVRNFRGVKGEVELNLTNLPNTNIFTLVGLNESGKTSILEAINLFQNKVTGNEAHKMIHKSKKGNFNDTISVRAFLELDEEDEDRIKNFCKDTIGFTLTQKIKTAEISRIYKFKNSNFDTYESRWTLPLRGKKGKSRTEVDLHIKHLEDWKKVVKYIEDNFPRILYYENFLFDFPQRIYLSAEDSLNKEEKEYRKILQDILDSFDNGLGVASHLLERLENPSPENEGALESLLGDISQKLTEVIFKNWNEVFLKDSKEIELKTFKDEIKGYYLQLKIKQGKDRFSIDERSLGFRWFFSFLLFTEFRKERKEDFGETLFLLDEPASNLHQKSQMKLLGIFEKLSKHCKIIYSTHSHYLVNPKYLAGTYIVKNRAINYDEEENFDQNETDISATLYKNFVSNYPNEKDHFKPILDAIDYTPSSFELVEKIICVEGKNDYYTFKYLQTVIFKAYNFNFYPGASVTKYEDLFRLYTAWNKDLLAVFDSDRQGKKEQLRYITQISPELKDRIFTLEDIDSDWKDFTTEDLFTNLDKIKIIGILFPGETIYNKSKFNTSLQELFISGQKIKLEPITRSNFKKIFEFIKKNV